jgi:hypothetical protein
MRCFVNFCFLVITLNLFAQNESSKYFKHLVFRETPLAETKGRIPISLERAKNENHYKITYDTQNRVRKIEYRFGDKLIRLRRSGMLDGNRNLAPKTVIDYKDNEEIRIFFNTDNLQTDNLMRVYKEVYTLNNEGRRINLKHFDRNDYMENNSWGIHEYIWTYKNENEILEKRKNIKDKLVYMRPYYLFLYTHYTYTDEGILVSMKNVDKDFNLVEEDTGIAIDVPKYDENYNLTGYNFYNSKNELTVGTFLGSAGGEVDYDKNGNVTEYRTTGLDGEPMIGKRPYVYRRFIFDDYGNMIERTFYGLENEIVITNDIAKLKFYYSKIDPSQLLETRYIHSILKE